MLPAIYSLENISVRGEVWDAEPGVINCVECGREVLHYERLRLVLEQSPECDLLAAKDGAYFVSTRFLVRLQSMSARGYTTIPVPVSLTNGMPVAPPFHYLVISGWCDGPWLSNERLAPCPLCSQPQAKPIDFEGAIRRLSAGEPAPTRSVYRDSWHGEDFFYVSEPGAAFVTERIAGVLQELRNLEMEEMAPDAQEMVRQYIPNWAENLEKRGWRTPHCCKLSPAEWIDRGVV